ncbi:MAG: hypothetical protein JNJ54_05260, partial [Myxococcaceae bacterium]|nr:hypothetical protein [Myxococcaceae bacterium]
GSTAGGSTAGGSTAGGSTAGGSTAGGSTAGGSTAGGSTAGGSTAGGSTAGGSTAGGSAAGGSAGGSTAGGSAGGSTAGGSAGAPNFMVLRVGFDGGTASPSGVGTPGYLDEHASDTGAWVRSIVLSNPPVAGSPLVFSGSATSDGVVNRSVDGQYVTVTGYLSAINTSAVVTAPNVTRCVARVNAAGAVDFSTLVNDAYQWNNIRSAATNNGAVYWLGGTSTNNTPANQDAGVRLVVHGSAGPTTSIYNIVTNIRATFLTSNALYASTGSGTAPDGGTEFSRVFSLGPTPMAQTSTQIYLGGINLNNPQGIAVLDLSATVAGDDTIYVSDTNSAGGVRKFTFNGMVWTETAQFILGVTDGGVGVNTSCLQVAAKQVGPDIVVLCTTSETHTNRVVRFVDVGGASTGQPVGATIVTAPAFQAFRGVAFSPQ